MQINKKMTNGKNILTKDEKVVSLSVMLSVSETSLVKFKSQRSKPINFWGLPFEF
jgi:hypothetical protein